MSDNASQKRPFRSSYGGGWITAQQLLAEVICARIARRDNVELVEGFWKSPRWSRECRLQLVLAASLLKEFSVAAVLAALKTTRGKRLYSLGLKSVLVPLIQAEQERLDR